MTDPVFLHYDQAALDAQYAHFDRVPGARDILARHDAAAARVLTAQPFVLLRYGAAPSQIIHITAAPQAEKPGGEGPLVVFFHGGGWRFMSPMAFAHVVPAFHAMGASVALPGFVQRPDATMPEIVAQCRAAVATLARQSQGSLPGNGRLVVAGVSSGAHLAAMCALPEWAVEAGITPGRIAGAICLCGMYDLEPLHLSGRNEDLSLDVATARALSPAQGDGSGLAPPPLVVAYGATESVEMARQAVSLAASWRRADAGAAVIAAAGRNHFDLLDDLSVPNSALAAATQRLLRHGAAQV